MKNLITLLIFALTISLSAQEIQPDSIAVELSVVEKGYYTVFIDSTQITRHSKALKAVGKANELSLKYPTADVWIKQPNLVTRADLKVYGKQSEGGKEEFTAISDNADFTLNQEDFKSYDDFKVEGSFNTIYLDANDVDTGYLYIINPDLKNIVFNGIRYSNYKQITFIQYSTGWEIFN